jgi:ADP-dependent NAD(P)H-hydrate dehydratase / NAD(P)H-hydrate epimerase
MTPKDMMVAEANAEAIGISRSSLMENAGKCLARKIARDHRPCKVAIFAGNGGNGGDGFVAARHLLNQGFEVEIFLLTHPSLIKSEEAKLNWEVLQQISRGLGDLKLEIVLDSSYLRDTDAEIVVDALLGTGVSGVLREPISTAVDIINNLNGFKIAVDMPTGIDPDSGMVIDKAVRADVTVTFHRVKVGLNIASVEYVGSIEVCDIGIPHEVELFTGPGDLLRLQKRDFESHKGQNGRVMVVGGSKDYSGAPALAAISSLRSGADLAVVACPKLVSSVIQSYSPDLIVRSVGDELLTPRDTEKILELAKNVDSVILGCGIGVEDETALALNVLLEKIQNPMVIDADALKIIDVEVLSQRDYETVLTPHKTEFNVLFGQEVLGNLESMTEVVLDASQNSECSVLLKSSVDIIASGDKLRLNSTGNPGMTVGGTGDCLAGLVGGLMAQGHDGFEASLLGAYINGMAGDLAAMEYGYNFTATDILSFIPRVFKEYVKYE